MLDVVFGPVDAALGFLSPLVRVLVYGTVFGAAAMTLYGWLSNQERIARLKLEVVDARRRLAAYDDTEFYELWDRVKQSMMPSLRLIAVVVPPTLIAAVPILALTTWMQGAYADHVVSLGPHWLRTWHVPFVAAVSAAAVIVKYALHIK